MITQCPHCKTMLDYPGNPGELADCASCGKMFEVAPPRQPKTQITTNAAAAHGGRILVEKTAKKYKAAQAIFLITLFVGLIWSIATQAIIGYLLFFIGLIGWITAKILAWWNHG